MSKPRPLPRHVRNASQMTVPNRGSHLRSTSNGSIRSATGTKRGMTLKRSCQTSPKLPIAYWRKVDGGTQLGGFLTGRPPMIKPLAVTATERRRVGVDDTFFKRRHTYYISAYMIRIRTIRGASTKVTLQGKHEYIVRLSKETNQALTASPLYR